MTCPEVRCWCVGSGRYGWQPEHVTGYLTCPIPPRHSDRCPWHHDLPPQSCAGAPCGFLSEAWRLGRVRVRLDLARVR